MTAWRFSDEVLQKARRYWEEGKVTRDHAGAYTVQGSRRTPYRVLTDANEATRKATWIKCTCRHGETVGRATCSHAAAVIMLIVHGQHDDDGSL